MALEECMGEQLEEALIHVVNVVRFEFAVAVLDQAGPPPQTGICFDFRDFLMENGRSPKGGHGIMSVGTPAFIGIGNPVHPLRVFMVTVITQLVLNPEQDQDAAGCCTLFTVVEFSIVQISFQI
jgi:hypothetical protein